MNPAFFQTVPSLIRALNSRKRVGDVDLGMGEPVLPVELAPFEAALEHIRRHGCPYSPNPGYLELREAVAAHYHYPFHSQGAQVCITVGSEEALYLALRVAVDPACQAVLIAEPAYPAYEKICQVEGITTRRVSFSADDGFAPRAAPVLEALGPDVGALVLASPVNPTGRVWPESELRLLTRALLERPGPPIQVIWDEVYRELYYGEDPPVSLASLYPHTWVAGSLSKSHALTGLRLGWLMAPPEGISSALKLHQLMVTSPNTHSQLVGLEVLRNPGSFAAHRNAYRLRRETLLAGLEDFEVEHVPPEGAFYCFVRLPEHLREDSLRAAFALVEHAGVVTIPGAAFGPEAEGWLRLSFVAEPARIFVGVSRLVQGLQSVRLELATVSSIEGER